MNHKRTSSNVSVESHTPDFSGWAELTEPVLQRLQNFVQADEPGCVFINPAATVRCRERSRQFLNEARRQQKAWCIRSKRALGKNWYRVVPTLDPAMRKLSKQEKYAERCLAYSGLLLFNSRIIYPNQWSALFADVSAAPIASRV